MVNVPITICTAQLFRPDQLFVISLWLNLWIWQNSARTAWIFCSNILYILVTDQGQRPSHDLHCSTSVQISALFISLIKSLNLNLAGLIEYFASAAHHWLPNLKPKSFTCLFAASNALLAGAGAAGEQTADHGGGESGEADPQQLNTPASSQRQRPGRAPRHSGWLGCCQAAVNKPASALVPEWFGSMHGQVPELLASKQAGRPCWRAVESGSQRTYSTRVSMYTVCTL